MRAAARRAAWPHRAASLRVRRFMSFVQSELGFHGCPAQLPQSNVSPRTRGGPRPDQVERLASVLSKDMALWGAHCGGADAAARRGHAQGGRVVRAAPGRGGGGASQQVHRQAVTRVAVWSSPSAIQCWSLGRLVRL